MTSAEPPLSWNSPEMREIETEWKELQDAYRKTPERIPGDPGKDKYAMLEELVDGLFKTRLSDRDLRQLAATIPAMPESGFVNRVVKFMARALVDSGDRESLVKLLSRRCPGRVSPYDYIEFYLLHRGSSLRDPILILGEAYSKSQRPETRRALAAAARRSFAGFEIQGKNDDEYVRNAMRWYENDRANLAVNPQYAHNEVLMPLEVQELNPERYAQFLRSSNREPLFRKHSQLKGISGSNARAGKTEQQTSDHGANRPASVSHAVGQTELAKLEGTWELIKVVDNGKRVAQEKVNGFRFVFHDETLEWIRPDKDKEAEFRLRLGRDRPGHIDLSRMAKSVLNRGQTTPLIYELQEELGWRPAIYELKGATLRLCLPAPGSRRRPLSFNAEEGSHASTFTLMRVDGTRQGSDRQVDESDAAQPSNAKGESDRTKGAFLKNRPAVRSARNAETQTLVSGGIEMAFRLIDETSDRVRDAKIGTSYTFFIQPGTEAKQTEWEFAPHVVSDADGVARLVAGLHEFPRHLVCRDASRGLVAVQWIERRSGGQPIDVSMHPECRVSGKLKCEELESLSGDLGWTNVQLSIEKRVVMEYRGPDGHFHFYVPPGDFSLGILGNNIKYTKRPFHVAPGQRDLPLGDVAVPAAGFALLVGKPAPELRGVDVWKNSPGLKLADMRGDWVLLTFFGPWAGFSAAVGQQMRELLEVRDKYHDRGLKIIAVFWSVAPLPPDKLAEDFDQKIAAMGKHEWKGRELPFPVALLTKTARLGSGGTVGDAIRADYGIIGWPPSVLIAPEGTVVGGLDVRTIDGIALLDRYVGKEAEPKSAIRRRSKRSGGIKRADPRD